MQNQKGHQTKITNYIHGKNLKSASNTMFVQNDHKEYGFNQQHQFEFNNQSYQFFCLILPEFLNNDWQTIKNQISSVMKKATKDNIKRFIQINIQRNLRYIQKKVNLQSINVDHLDEIDVPDFWSKTIPFMLSECSKQTSMDVMLLIQKQNAELTFTRRQIHYILCHMFFCTMPIQPNINQIKTFGNLMIKGKQLKAQKLKCLAQYFVKYQHLTQKQKVQKVSFKRVFHETRNYYRNNREKEELDLIDVRVTKQQIQSFSGQIMIDFANKHVGGGILNNGAVQQEILFCIHPELIIASLISYDLLDNEALIIKGFKRFSSYEGYSSTFTHKQLLTKDYSSDKIMVVIDATDFSNKQSIQFFTKSIDRQIHKAFVGLYYSSHNLQKNIVGGKWGCGAFKGESHLKFIIQWLVCSIIEKSFIFSNFGSQQQNEVYQDVVRNLKQYGGKVKDLFSILHRIHSFRQEGNGDMDIFDYINIQYV